MLVSLRLKLNGHMWWMREAYGLTILQMPCELQTRPIIYFHRKHSCWQRVLSFYAYWKYSAAIIVCDTRHRHGPLRHEVAAMCSHGTQYLIQCVLFGQWITRILFRFHLRTCTEIPKWKKNQRLRQCCWLRDRNMLSYRRPHNRNNYKNFGPAGHCYRWNGERIMYTARSFCWTLRLHHIVSPSKQ